MTDTTEAKPAEARKPFEITGPTILVENDIRYIRNGPMILNTVFLAESPFVSGKVDRTARALSLKQPTEWKDDDTILASVSAEYPGATVLWMTDVEPEV